MSEANTAPRDTLIGSRIDGRYTVHRELGRGGMGVVYEGVHDELGRPVAIKVLNTAWASDPTAVARFLREARTASSFSHGNIVDVSDLGRLPDGRPFLVMPKIAGVDLASLLRESGVQPAKRVAELLIGVAAALDLIHVKGFVHRDIKPENLMYVVREDCSETVMLLDFGIAAAVMSNEPRLTGQGAIFGTPQFMPPEVCSGGMPDARGDVYALATVAFELITGHLPFGDDNMMRVLTEKLTSDPPSLSEVSGLPFPPELEHVIARGLARDPDERYPSASEFVNALKAATEYAPVSWKSGVLRPSLRSDAHPVGSYGHQSTVQERGRVRSSPLPPSSSRPEPPRGSTPRPEAPRGNTPRQSPRSSPVHGSTPYADSQRPRAQQSWTTDAYREEEYQLGAGLRASERSRTMSVKRSRGGIGMLLVLAAAAAAAVVLWIRQDQAGVAPASGAAAAAPSSPQPGAPGVLAPAPAQPSAAPQIGQRPRANAQQPAAAAHAQQPAAAVHAQQPVAAAHAQQPVAAAHAQQPAAAAQDPQPAAATTDPQLGAAPANGQPSEPAPGDARGQLGVVATIDPSSAGELPAATTPATPAPAASDPAAQQLPKGVSPQAAPVVPKTPVAVLPPPAAAKQTPAPRVPAVAPPRPVIPADPPAPGGYEPAAASEFSAPEDSPVLTVQEEAPVEEEEPELPVRPPEHQAAQLAREATTSLLAGEVSHAISLLREATRLDPTHALAWRTLGLALERSGNRSGALNAYQQYIQLAPHGPQSEMVRDRMRALEQ